MLGRSLLSLITATLVFLNVQQLPFEEDRSAKAAELPVVGLIADADESNLMYRAAVDRLLDTLARHGWQHGENYTFQAEYTGGYTEYVDKRLDALSAQNLQVLVSMSNDATAVAEMADTTEPIVMAPGFDAVVTGLVTDLASPDGRVTGVSIPDTALWAAKIEVLRQIIPNLEMVAVMGDVYNEDGVFRLARAVDAIRALDLEVERYEISRSDEILQALTDAADKEAQALLLVEGQELIDRNRATIAWHAVSKRLPTIATARDFADDGILLSVGPSRAQLQEHVATFVAALLDGTPVADLPVLEVGFEVLTINKSTQNDLQLAIPDELLASAVIVE